MGWRNADEIAPKGGSYEPVRQFSFTAYFQYLGNDVELAVMSTNLPTVTNDPIIIDYMNESRKVAGKTVVQDGDITIRDYIDPDICAACDEWASRVRSVKEGKIYRAADYKCDGEMVLYDGEGNLHKRWKLIGCWPSSFNPGQLDYSASDQVQITLTINIDKAYVVS